MFLRLPPPESAAQAALKGITNVEAINAKRKLNLSEKRFTALEHRLKKQYEAWENGTGTLHTKLRELNEFLEGKEEQISEPFGDGKSSNVDVKLAQSHARTLAAHFKRTVFADPSQSYVAEKGPGATADKLKVRSLQDAVNWTAENDTNLNDELRSSPTAIFRDGTALCYGDWERRIEHGVDARVYSTVEDFRADYPDADSTGMGEQEYAATLSELDQPDAALTVEYELDFVAYEGPEYTLFPLAKFVFYPFNMPDMRKLSLYGYKFVQSGLDFNLRSKYGFYDKDSVEEVRKRTPETVVDEWDASIMAFEGIGDSVGAQVQYDMAVLVVKTDLDNDGVPEVYKVWFECDKKKVLRVERYAIRWNIPCIVPYRFIHRPGRLLGGSLLWGGEFLYREVNAIHRHRGNVRRLTDSVTLVLPNALKEELDLGAEYATFRPGMTLWIPDQLWNRGMKPEQLVIQNMAAATRNSGDEESLIIRFLEMNVGPSAGMSGQEAPSDPNAPASKTAMLLQRSDTRTDDYFGTWAQSIPHQMDLHRALYYQNAHPTGKVGYMVRAKGEMESKEVPVAILGDPTVRMALKKVRLANSPEQEMQKVGALMLGAMKFMIPVKIKPAILIEGWNDYVVASGVDRPERFMIEMQDDGSASMPGAPPMPSGNLQSLVDTMLQSGQDAGQPAGPKGPATPMGGLMGKLATQGTTRGAPR